MNFLNKLGNWVKNLDEGVIVVAVIVALVGASMHNVQKSPD
jgi:hypothetical protein